MIMKPKILKFDIETAPNKVWVWGYYEQNVISVIQDWYIITFSYKLSGDNKIHTYSLPDFKLYKRDKTNDRAICKELWKLFDEADIVMAHNGFSFDVKKSQARFIKHGFKPPSPFQQIDTLKVARKHFKFDCNKLDELARYLGIGRKLHHEGKDLWLGCIERDDPKAWKKMGLYCEQDVVLLDAVYDKFRPYMTTHPNYNVYMGTQYKCPNCGGRTTKQGTKPSRAGMMQQYRCKELKCLSWSSKPLKGILR